MGLFETGVAARRRRRPQWGDVRVAVCTARYRQSTEEK